jgi:hypothetical protein
MKKYILPGLLAIAPVVALAQQPVKDTAKERNSLIQLRAKLVQEMKGLQEDVSTQQTILDSVSGRLATDSVYMDKKKIKSIRKLMDKQTNDLKASKAQLKQASELVKELDDQIRQLQK